MPSTDTQPCFIQHIPGFVSGVEPKLFEFNTKKELFNKFNKLDDKTIYVYSDNYLMIQSLGRKFWWVMGVIKNYDLKELGIPKVNYDIYNKDETVNTEKLNEWLKANQIK